MLKVDARVGEVMTRELLTIEQNELLARADELMHSARIRHILAVDEDGLLRGVLSQRDIFHGGLIRALGFGTRARQQALDSLRVKDAMTCDPVTTTPDVAIAAAARLMVERKIGCLPVTEGERLLGILTESDFARIVAGLKQPVRAP
jgi:CBS domain-containing protein